MNPPSNQKAAIADRIRGSISAVSAAVDEIVTEDYQAAVKTLLDLGGRLEIIGMEIDASVQNSTMDEDVAWNLERLTKEAVKRLKSKLDEIGYEDPDENPEGI